MGLSAAATICLVVCHAGPADHFAVFADSLEKKGYGVQIFAAGPALKKLQDRKIERLMPFSLDNEGETAAQIAKQCAGAKAVLTDVGHPFDVALQQALAEQTPEALRLAYYDNPEVYVPGGYSAVAAQVMRAAQGVFFANATLAKTPLFEAPGQEVSLKAQKRSEIGYYPLAQAQKIADRRKTDSPSIRKEILDKHRIPDRGQQLLVYAGGNNSDYFEKAFPAFLKILTEAAQTTDLSNTIVLLQQHPGAKEKNLDAKMLQAWVEENSKNGNVPQAIVSSWTSDEAQIAADKMLYYQTSMGPQFVLAGIPTLQVGHNVYEDILVRNRLCPTATNGAAFLDALKKSEGPVDPTAALEGLGIRSNWAERLEQALTRS